MDAHVFRVIGQELMVLLSGARIEKIHGPFRDVYVLLIYTHGEKIRLVIRCERQNPQLFFTELTFVNPPRPNGNIMRLRKYAGGKRLGDGKMQFWQRRLLFPIQRPEGEETAYLLIDMRDGMSIVHTPPEDFARAPVWPDEGALKEFFASASKESHDAGMWAAFPVLTPLLRESLAAMDPMDGRALLVDLEAGEGDLFFYADREGESIFYSAWPLPKSLQGKRKLHEIEMPEKTGLLPKGTSFFLDRTSAIDAKSFFSSVAYEREKETTRPVKQEEKKRKKLREKLDQEEKRLQGLMALREQAQILQENLWRFPVDFQCDSVTLPSSKDPEGAPEHIITLNNHLTVRENMLHLFRQSARGARGLRHLAERKKQMEQVGTPAEVQEKTESFVPAKDISGETPQNGLRESLWDGEKHVARFISSDGMTLLRGKNAKGNARLLKIGQPHDIWLHAKDGPSAHVIIRRHHAAQEVPEKTLQEAGYLVGERSWQRYDARAEIMTAYLRYVHSIKGAAAGTVHVDKVLSVFFVSLDSSAH